VACIFKQVTRWSLQDHINPALRPHVAKYKLHKMGLATGWLAIYADDEWWPQIFHSIYIHNIKKITMNEHLMAMLEASPYIGSIDGIIPTLCSLS